MVTDRSVASMREIWFFFASVFVLNTLFIMSLHYELLPGSLFRFGRFWLLFGILVVVVILWRGWHATLELLKPLTVWRVNPLWFLGAAMVPILSSVVFITVVSLITGAPLELYDWGPKLFERRRLMLAILVSALVGEVVWVGYAIRNLNFHFTPVTSAFIVGAFWAGWWLPMSYFQMGIIPGLSFFSLWASMTGVAFFCTFFYRLTKSGLVICVMQVCLNSSLLFFAVLQGPAGDRQFEFFSIFYLLTGIFLVTVIMPRLEGRQRLSDIGTAG